MNAVSRGTAAASSAADGRVPALASPSARPGLIERSELGRGARLEAGAAAYFRTKSGPRRQRVRFLGLDFDALHLDEAVSEIVERANLRDGFVYVATPNVDHRVRLEREPTLVKLYDDAWLTLCDSRILQMLARAAGDLLPAAPGADVVEALLEREIDRNETVTIIGGSKGMIDALAAKYGLKDVRWHDAPMGLRNNPAAIAAAAAFAAANPARFVFIAVGSPQQELVARAISERGDAIGVGICCGISLSFASGEVSRAPKWMRSLALEWLFRLAIEPRRMSRRYLVEAPAILPIWLRRSHERLRGETN